MNREELDKRLDEWLDRAAAEYGRAGMRPGIEARVIANLNSRLEKRKRYFRWIPVAAAAAILVSSVLIFRTEFLEQGPAKIASNKQIEVHSAPKPAGTAAVPATKPSPKPQRLNKPTGRFLSSGLSDQERYLIAFARAASDQNITGLSGERKFEPVQIPDLEIPEFEIPEFEITFNTEAFRPPNPESEDAL